MCDYLGLVWLKSVTFVNEFEAKMTTNVLKQDQNTEKVCQLLSFFYLVQGFGEVEDGGFGIFSKSNSLACPIKAARFKMGRTQDCVAWRFEVLAP